jgi:hypothetical protein
MEERMKSGLRSRENERREGNKKKGRCDTKTEANEWPHACGVHRLERHRRAA